MAPGGGRIRDLITFAVSFFIRAVGVTWRVMGFAVFIGALFTEMYGLPLNARLAAAEESEARATFGDAYGRYAAATPRFLPLRFRRRVAVS